MKKSTERHKRHWINIINIMKIKERYETKSHPRVSCKKMKNGIFIETDVSKFPSHHLLWRSEAKGARRGRKSVREKPIFSGFLRILLPPQEETSVSETSPEKTAPKDWKECEAELTNCPASGGGMDWRNGGDWWGKPRHELGFWTPSSPWNA